MFISEPRGGLYYVAKRSRKGYRKYLWSMVTTQLLEETSIQSEQVPEQIRREAHNLFRRGYMRSQL